MCSVALSSLLYAVPGWKEYARLKVYRRKIESSEAGGDKNYGGIQDNIHQGAAGCGVKRVHTPVDRGTVPYEVKSNKEHRRMEIRRATM